MFFIGAILDPDQDIGIQQLSHKKAADARQNDSWNKSQDCFEGFLISPIGIWRRDLDDVERSQDCHRKTEDDGSSSRFKAVHLTHHVTDDVHEWEEEGASVSDDGSDVNQFHRTDVRNQQNGTENCHDIGIKRAVVSCESWTQCHF